MSRGIDTADRRARILDAAARLLSRDGIGKTGVARIAREAGVAVGSVYLEFASKDAIVEALSLGRFEGLLSEMRAAASTGPWARRVRGFMTRRAVGLRALGIEGAHGAEILRGCCPGAERAWCGFKEAERALLTTLITEARDAGAFAIDDVDATVSALLRAYATFAPPAVLDCESAAFERELEALHTLVLDGLLAR